MNYHYTTAELCQIFEGNSRHLSHEQTFERFSIDSRKTQPGDLFFAIAGENTDGHLYLKQALERGAQGIIAHQGKLTSDFLSRNPPLILVADPNRALRDLAENYRKRFSKGRVLGITGSNGKTSAKEIAADLCRFLTPNTHATAGNLNNFFGVPLTILSATLEEAWWVIEMGTNQFGEIETLSKIVKPHLSLITNIGESHLEFLENTQGVAREKAGLFAGMTPGSITAIPATLLHQEIVSDFATRHQIQLVSYGFSHWETSQPSDYPAKIISVSPALSEFEWLGQKFTTSQGNPLLLGNLLGVLTLLHLCEVPLDLLCEATQALPWNIKGRMQFRETGSFLLVDDTYNANPTSFNSVLTSLKQLYPQRRLLVVAGAMAELGRQSPEFHTELGKHMQKSQVAHLLAFGDNDACYYVNGWQAAKGRSEDVFHTDDLEALVTLFYQVIQPNDVVLVKGSRSSQMEHFVNAVLESEETNFLKPSQSDKPDNL